MLIFCSCAMASSKLKIATSLRIYERVERQQLSKQCMGLEGGGDFPILSLFESDNWISLQLLLIVVHPLKKEYIYRHIVCRLYV